MKLAHDNLEADLRRVRRPESAQCFGLTVLLLVRLPRVRLEVEAGCAIGAENAVQHLRLVVVAEGAELGESLHLGQVLLRDAERAGPYSPDTSRHAPEDKAAAETRILDRRRAEHRAALASQRRVGAGVAVPDVVAAHNCTTDAGGPCGTPAPTRHRGGYAARTPSYIRRRDVRAVGLRSSGG